VTPSLRKGSMRPAIILLIVILQVFLAAQTQEKSRQTTTKEAAKLDTCQQTLRNTSNLIRLGGFEDIGTGKYEVGNLVQVYADARVQAYVDEYTIDEAVKLGVYNGTFAARIYFVYKNESARLETIAAIKTHTPIPRNKSCQIAVTTRLGTTYERDQDCADVNGTEEGNIDDLKYIMMKVGYSQMGPYGLALSNGSGHIPGPLLYIYDNLYLAPRDCTRSLMPDKSGEETIMGLADPVSDSGPIFSPTFIGRTYERSTNGRTTAPAWHPLIGDLTAAESELGFNPVKVGPHLTPLMYEVLENINNRIKQNAHRY
jgi:hypothetical protein